MNGRRKQKLGEPYLRGVHRAKLLRMCTRVRFAGPGPIVAALRMSVLADEQLSIYVVDHKFTVSFYQTQTRPHLQRLQFRTCHPIARHRREPPASSVPPAELDDRAKAVHDAQGRKGPQQLHEVPRGHEEHVLQAQLAQAVPASGELGAEERGVARGEEPLGSHEREGGHGGEGARDGGVNQGDVGVVVILGPVARARRARSRRRRRRPRPRPRRRQPEGHAELQLARTYPRTLCRAPREVREAPRAPHRDVEEEVVPRAGEPRAAEEGARAEGRLVYGGVAEAEGVSAAVDDAFAELYREARPLHLILVDEVIE
ncbi:hypothetical protein C8T65DRAFT_694382 [Cerioporus squamosus]|nr:hypothetical protein C8T65DRAFT_694382 [Cerioporus squamosus]